MGQQLSKKGAPCHFWPYDLPRPKNDMCGKPASRGALAPPWAPEPLTPICEACIKAYNYEPEFLRDLP
jgi:hypothetical protein